MPASGPLTLSATHPGRLAQLDALRTVAIILVIGRHMPEDWHAGGGRWLNAWNMIGWTGVDLFFVISGFLIGGILFAEFKNHGRIDTVRFYIRRAFKIWPAYFVFLALATATTYVNEHRARSIASLLWETRFNWLHLQNYFGSPYFHTWSLAVEEHFYLVLPIALIVMIRVKAGQADPFRHLTLGYFLVAVMCLALRVITATTGPYKAERSHFPTHLRIDSLFAGVVLAYWVTFRRESIERLRPWRMSLLAMGIAAFLPMMFITVDDHPFVYTVGFLELAIGSAAIVLWAWFISTSGRPAGAITRGLAWVGFYSYSIYLYHYPIGEGAARRLAHRFFATNHAVNPGVGMAIFVLCAITIGVIAYLAVEGPLLVVRNCLWPTRIKPVQSRPADENNQLLAENHPVSEP